jgi:general stress protein YciG
MAGTRIGGLKAAEKNKLNYGEDFYREIGSRGGKKSRTGGFFANRELARIAGYKGGKKSRRTGVPNRKGV